MKRLMVAVAVASVSLFAAPAAFAEDEVEPAPVAVADDEGQVEPAPAEIVEEEDEVEPASDAIAEAEGAPVLLTLATATMTATFDVPEADVEAMRESLAGGYVNSELLGCYEHADPDRFTEVEDVTVCEPSAFVTAVLDSGETTGIAATFEDAAYTVDLSVVQLDGDGGATLEMELPVTGVDGSQEAESMGTGVKVGLVSAAVLSALAGGFVIFKRRS